MLFCIWYGMKRYRVVTYEDHLVVTPFVGRPVTIAYADITALRWSRLHSGFTGASINVFVGDKRIATLWDGIDIDQGIASGAAGEILQPRFISGSFLDNGEIDALRAA